MRMWKKNESPEACSVSAAPALSTAMITRQKLVDDYSSASSRHGRLLLLLTSFCVLLIFLLFRTLSSSPVDPVISAKPRPRGALHHRRLLELATDRVGDGRCSASDITVLQGEGEPLPDGIPTFSVQIFNGCTSPTPSPTAGAGAGAGTAGGAGEAATEDPDDCCGGMAHIHVACGWWATAKLVNPAIFRRLGFNDCLVNDGRPLKPGHLLTFEYANSFPYPMTVTSVSVSPCS